MLTVSGRQAILESPGNLQFQDKEFLEPGVGELLIRVKAATTCGTDLKAFLRGHPMIPMPGPFGHEWSGEVVEAGAGAKFKKGDAVMGVHTAPCRTCFWCQHDQENLCETIMETKVLGAFADYLLIPKRIADCHVFEKPASLSFQTACLLEPLSCVMEGCRQINPQPGDRVGIAGPGAIGILFALALKGMGLDKVSLFGRSSGRIAAALAMGIDAQPLHDAPSGNWDAFIECTGSLEMWERAPFEVRRGGTAVLFGGLPQGTKAGMDATQIHYGQVKILSPFHFGTGAVLKAKTLLEAHPDLFGSVISGDRPLADLEPALEDLSQRRGIKYALIP